MPQRIQVLPPSIAERIAAGEVIERPASVVKELIENSLDAGATEVSVHLGAGGKERIDVVDNGHGMDAADLGLCLKRHATSKLRSLEDLERILTLGFRGEALPSVAAVSELTVISRAAGSPTAFSLKPGSAEPSETSFGHFMGSAHGTRIEALGLFSQVPARLKFLRAQGAEVSQVRDWMERLALTRPDVGFELKSDERTLLKLRPLGASPEEQEKNRIRAILSDGVSDSPIVSGHAEENGLKIRAHWLQGLSFPTPKRLVQIVNGRAVKDRLLQQAVLAPFRQALMPGQFPAIALYLETLPALIDVNVHPSKAEIRFLESRLVFQAVQAMVESMIRREGAPAWAKSDSSLSKMELEAPPPAFAFRPRVDSETRSPLFTVSEPVDPSPAEAPMPAPSAMRSASHSLPEGRMVGTVFNTYIMYELGGELGLIDQHAAHERIRYERLRRRFLEGQGAASSQILLTPEAVGFQAEQRPLLEERLGHLTRLGFEAELFGEDALLFRAVPSEWGNSFLNPRLQNLVSRLLETNQELTPLVTPLIMDESLFEKLASEACHSAVRAGDRLEPQVAEAIVSQLMQCEHPWNCPHGRPTFVRVARARFEEWFQRRV